MHPFLTVDAVKKKKKEKKVKFNSSWPVVSSSHLFKFYQLTRVFGQAL